MSQRTPQEQFDKQATHYDGQWNAWTEESLDWMVRDKAQRATAIHGPASHEGHAIRQFQRSVGFTS